MATTPPAAQAASKPPTAPLFDFVKRKRWADVLMAELYDTMGFIITPDTRIIYCQCAGMSELHGWSENDFIDCDLTEFVNFEDQEHFLDDLRESLIYNEERTTYARLKPKQYLDTLSPLEEITYEFRVRPHAAHTENPNVKVLILAVKESFRGQNTLADQMSDLKAENQRLLERAASLRGLVASDPAAAERVALLTAGNSSSSIYSSSSLAPTSMDVDEVLGGQRDSGDAGNLPPPQSIVALPEDEAEDAPKKKKWLKKVQGTEKHVCVTCGRTDSPEWRRGPLGPKTLCNACGLRWAKQVKKTGEEPTEVTAREDAADP